MGATGFINPLLTFCALVRSSNNADGIANPVRLRFRSDFLHGFMLSHSFAFAITGYQRYLSPYKGFCCAHRVRHGGVSCSEFVRQALLSDGLWRAWPAIRLRFAECKTSALALRWEREEKRRKRQVERQQNSSPCGSDYADCCDAAGLISDVASCIPNDCSALEAAGGGCDACSCSL